MKAAGYLLCILAGMAAGSAATFLASRPTLTYLAQTNYGHLALDYASILSADGEYFGPGDIDRNFRKSLATQFIHFAPLYRYLQDDNARAASIRISRGVIEHRPFDVIGEVDLRQYAYEAAGCIASLQNENDDPMPCLESHARTRMQAGGIPAPD
ncbi:hypothetical protein [Luteimonas huabeiensis]|uniref:hypothetical protein n=1 Tax=Luteimonas huabeiensis TaxID=1244513 RepID=UPI0004675731|nr:hypothetical protein [Luteimonas huabeiensis]